MNNHISVVIDRIRRLSNPKSENTTTATDPFKAASNNESMGIQEAIKYMLEIADIACTYEISILKHSIKK